MGDMEILQLRYFQTIAKYENMSKAAEELHVSQPSLSSSLSRLERELGKPLFDRIGRRIVLNDYGKYYLKISKNILGLIAVSQYSYIQEQETQKLSIGFLNYNDVLLELTNRFLEQYPEVTIDCFGSTLGVPFDYSGYDFIAGNHPMTFPYVVDKLRIDTCENYVVFPEDHPLAQKSSVSFQDISEEPFCCLRTNKGDYEPVYYTCIENGFVPRCVYSTNNAYYKFQFFVNGGAKRARGMFPRAWKEACETIPGVVLVPLIEGNKPDVFLTWRRDKELSPVAARFLDFVQSQLGLCAREDEKKNK